MQSNEAAITLSSSGSGSGYGQISKIWILYISNYIAHYIQGGPKTGSFSYV